jgi:hypothetical protein
MRKMFLITSVISIAVAAAVIACNSETKASDLPYAQPTANSEKQIENSYLSDASVVSRGKYLVTIMGCNDCHSPKMMTPAGPQPDPELLLSGHQASRPLPQVDTSAVRSWVLFNMEATAYVGPWGTSYAANITSDASGIGNWTFEQFERAMREGKYKGLATTRPLMPPMPWMEFRHATDEDLRSVFAYLKSTKPVRNVVPAYVPPTAVGKR